MTTPPSVLFLGLKARVNAIGNVDFQDAELLNNGSLLVNQQQLTSAITTLNENIAYLTENTTPGSIDSLTELVTRAAAIESTLTAAINTESAARELADNTESAARELADNIAKELSIYENLELPVSSSVFADAKPPIAKELSGIIDLSILGFDGWYYKNLHSGSGLHKINWYMPNVQGLKYKDINKLYMNFLCINNVSLPWITVYTVKKVGDNVDNKGTWYNSKLNLLPADNQVFEKNKSYHMIGTLPLNPSAPTMDPPLNHTSVDLFEGLFTLKSTSISPEDAILAISIHTDSGSSAGNVEIIVRNLLLQRSNGITSFNFRNADVLTKFANDRLDQVFKSFYGKSLLDTTFTPQLALPL
jgi:hypothetical protein